MNELALNIGIEVVKAYGHVNVTAKHRSTIELTKDEYLTPRGDCIIGIKACKALRDFSQEFKELVKRDGSIIIAIFIADDTYDFVVGRGSSKLTLTSDRKIIIRKSEYVDQSTIMIKSNKAAKDLNRRLIKKLRDPSAVLYAVFIALTPIQSMQ